MQVKKRLQINIAVLGITFFVLVIMLFLALNRVNRAMEESRIAGEILSSAFDRSTLRDDYLRNNNERAKVQWFARHEQIGRLLKAASEKFKESDDKVIVDKMIKDQEATGRLFSAIVENRETASSNTDSVTLSQETETRLASQLSMRLYDKVLLVRKLREAAEQHLFSSLRLAGWSIVCFIAIITAAAIINSWTINWIITNRIRRLRDGASVIGEGNLDYRIDIEGDDEFAELSGAFDAMTVKLHRSYRNLENEIAGRKRAQEDLKMALSELERSNRELEQFAYVASHDLQEPLRMVASYVRLLEKKYSGQLDEKADQYIHFAVDGALRMQKLIEGLLAYARIGRGGKFTLVDTNDVFSQVVSNLSSVLQESHAVITKGNLPKVPGDETQFMQLFQNLIGNAIKFRKPEVPPQVYVSAKREGKEWVFSVRDNGIGLDPAYADRIFLIFQRLHTREEYPGTGIGLALCKKIVERHHGRIWVESAPGEGAIFFFAIPG